MMLKGIVYTSLLGALAGCVLGAWVAWQHDPIVSMGTKIVLSMFPRLGVGLVFFGAVFGWALAWCAECVTQVADAQLWRPITAGLLTCVVVFLVWSLAAIAKPSALVLGLSLLAVTLPAIIAAAIRMSAES